MMPQGKVEWAFAIVILVAVGVLSFYAGALAGELYNWVHHNEVYYYHVSSTMLRP